MYAASGVPEYWVVDLVHHVVHVFTRPGAEGYAGHGEHSFDQPLDAAGVQVVIRDLVAADPVARGNA